MGKKQNSIHYMKTRVLIKRVFTLPLWGNYGGMLQAYALWLCVSRVHIETANVELQNSAPEVSLWHRIRECLWCVKYQLLPRREDGVVPRFLQQACADSFKRMLNTYVLSEDAVSNVAEFKDTQWIVGSDQVWRAVYTRRVRSVASYFLDFLPEEVRQRSIAYAASFGTDDWEGTPEETVKCRELLQQFKAVSVREHSGVKICREVFGVEAVQMPDPTLLPDVKDYVSLIESERTHQRKGGYIAAYVLDESERALVSLQAVAEAKGLPVQHLMPHLTAECRRDRFPQSVPQWLRYIKECDMVVTDSFHGCVFAIIFNKPFVCLGNEGRGSARFDTLFQTFHLESRLATSPEQAVAVACEPIDWDAVNAIHEHERERGLAFLRENLS